MTDLKQTARGMFASIGFKYQYVLGDTVYYSTATYTGSHDPNEKTICITSKGEVQAWQHNENGALKPLTFDHSILNALDRHFKEYFPKETHKKKDSFEAVR